MKKRYITGIVLACALSIGCAAAVAAGGGTSSDPLVNKSFLDGTYLPAAYGQFEARAAEKYPLRTQLSYAPAEGERDRERDRAFLI